MPKRTKIIGSKAMRKSSWLHGITGGNKFGGAKKRDYRRSKAKKK
jgi:hypothetical protein